jgi:hypothetical protein
MKNSLVLLLLFSANLLVAQLSINQYQYVIVPAQYGFQREVDEYRLNNLTKMLFEKYGFKVFLDTDPLPKEITDSNCDKLYADVISTGNFTRTKLQVILKDCKKNTVFASTIGTSKEKEYKVAYTQALRAAFQSFDTLQYVYTPKQKNSEIQKTDESVNRTVIISETFEENSAMLYAQTISNGFQLVDATPKVVMTIYKTSNSGAFLATKGTTQGVLIMNDNQWFFEYYESEKLVSENVNVKF